MKRKKTIAYKIKLGDLIGGGMFNSQMACLQNRARAQMILQNACTNSRVVQS